MRRRPNAMCRRCPHLFRVHERPGGDYHCGVLGCGCKSFARDWFGWANALRVIGEAEQVIEQARRRQQQGNGGAA